ncbi:MAG: hypothetical protein Q9163_000818 [Psora crenata]
MASQNLVTEDESPLLPFSVQSAGEHEHNLPPSFESHLQYPQPKPTPSDHSCRPSSRTQLTYNATDPDGQSILPSYQASKYGLYKSEEEYLAALRRWVDAKQCIETDPKCRERLVGFYGDKTMEERNERLNEERRLRKQAKLATKSVAETGGVRRADGKRRKSSFGGFLGMKSKSAEI